jgi:hypothetical protein
LPKQVVGILKEEKARTSGWADIDAIKERLIFPCLKAEGEYNGQKALCMLVDMILIIC